MESGVLHDGSLLLVDSEMAFWMCFCWLETRTGLYMYNIHDEVLMLLKCMKGLGGGMNWANRSSKAGETA